MKVTVRRALTKEGKCTGGRIVKRGRSRRRVCLVTVERSHMGRRHK